MYELKRTKRIKGIIFILTCQCGHVFTRKSIKLSHQKCPKCHEVDLFDTEAKNENDVVFAPKRPRKAK